MRYPAPNPEAYIEALPQDRRASVARLREAVRVGLPQGFAETMQYDMITYVVPHERYTCRLPCEP